MFCHITGFFSEASFSYFWFINGTNYGSSDAFEYQFRSPFVSLIEVFIQATVEVLDIDGPHQLGINETIDRRSNNNVTFGKLNATEMSSVYKDGRFILKVESRNPMTNVEYTGEA